MGDWDDFGFDLGNLATELPSVDTSNYVSDLSSMFRLGGDSGAPGITGDYSFGVDRGAGAPGLRLTTEASAPLATTGTSGGGGWSDWLKSFSKDFLSPVGDVAKAFAPIAGLGLAGLNVANSLGARDRMDRAEPILREAQQTQIQNARQGQDVARQTQELAPVAAALTPKIEAVAPRQGDLSQTVQRTIAVPQVEYATQLLAAARAGQLPASEEAELEQMRAAQLQKYRDYFARSGMGDSTGLLQVEAMVDRDISAQRAERLRRIENTALQYLGGGRESYSTAGTLNESEARILGRAAGPIGTAGQVLGSAGSTLAGSAGAAGGAARSVQAEEESLEKLIRDAYAQLNASMASK